MNERRRGNAVRIGAALMLLSVGIATSALVWGIVCVIHAAPVGQTPEEAVMAYKIAVLEESMKSIHEEHSKITTLLIGNLVSVIAAAVVYFFTGSPRAARHLPRDREP